MWSEGLGKLMKYNCLIGPRTRDLPSCNLVPQPLRYVMVTEQNVECNTLVYLRSVRQLLVTASVVPCHPDEGGAKFLRNVGSYKSHTE
jgi:hypothetical protein